LFSCVVSLVAMGRCSAVDPEVLPALREELQSCPMIHPVVAADPLEGDQVSKLALVRATGRRGVVIRHEPEDLLLPFKVRFDDGLLPTADWFKESALDLCPSTDLLPSTDTAVHLVHDDVLLPQVCHDQQRDAVSTRTSYLSGCAGSETPRALTMVKEELDFSHQQNQLEVKYGRGTKLEAIRAKFEDQSSSAPASKEPSCADTHCTSDGSFQGLYRDVVKRGDKRIIPSGIVSRLSSRFERVPAEQ